MRIVLFFIILLISNIAFGDGVRIKINPERPVMNEPFEVEFIIETEKGEDPQINFNPGSIEVISRNQGAVSTRTSYINGKMSYSRTISIKYEMIAKRSGSNYIRNINVEIDGKTLKHKTLRVNVLRVAAKAKDVFVVADVKKEQVFVGESILVRYYLYHKANTTLNSTDVKKFPKLDKFLKRYHQEKSIAERVSYKGEMYIRRVIYTAQLFGESAGNYKVDPISLRIGYTAGGASSFGNFGFGLRMGRLKKRTVISKPVEILVLPLPTDNVPPGFTGLVGKHQFKLTSPKQKYLSNEPIELQLTISGEGALELVEAPKLFRNDLIEEFETTGDLKINSDFTAEKKFDYTYLGRGNVNLEAFKYPLSYFDPETEKFVTVDLNLGPLKVVAIGNVIPLKKDPEKSSQDSGGLISDNSSGQTTTLIEQKILTFEPIYKSINSYIYYSKHLFYIVGSLLLLLLSFLTFKQLSSLKKRKRSLFQEIYAGGVTYSSLYKVLSQVGDYSSMEDNIEHSAISNDCKSYFKELIKTINSRFDKDSVNEKFKIQKKYFEELEHYIKVNETEDF